MSANTNEIYIRPGRAADTFEVVSPISQTTIIAAASRATVLAALTAQFPGQPAGTWEKALNDAVVRRGVRIAVATADREHRDNPKYGPLVPDDQLLP